MAHNITVRPDGVAEAAFAEVPAWHGLGTVLDHPMTSVEALRAAHLDWTVSKKPLHVVFDDGHSRLVDGKVALVRDDTKDVLGVASDKYCIVNNVEAFQFLDGLVEEGSMTYEAAFSLGGGKRVVLLARMPGQDEITPSDVCLRYILLSTSHDGTSSIWFGPTSVRVVCANTFMLAIGEKTVEAISSSEFDYLKKEFSISHRGDIEAKLEKARGIIKAVNAKFDEYTEQARELAKVRWTDAQFRQFLDIMCPEISLVDPDYTPRRAKAIERTRNDITELYYQHEWQADVSIRQTAWAAVNAVVQHIDYLPRRGATPQAKAEARFNMVLYGPGRDMKQRAFVAAQRISQLA